MFVSYPKKGYSWHLMNASDLLSLVFGLVTLYLLWQQNEIFKEQNNIFAKQEGVHVESLSRRVRFKTYWPLLVQVVLAIAALGVVGYDRLMSHGSAEACHCLTHVRMQVNNNGAATNLELENVLNWYVLRTEVRYSLASDLQGAPQHETMGAALFMVFDKPIVVQQFRIDGNGSVLPAWEVKQQTSRSAVIYFDGSLNNMIVDVFVDNK